VRCDAAPDISAAGGARTGAVLLGKATRGKAGVVRKDVARLGLGKAGMARQGTARQPRQRHGFTWEQVVYGEKLMIRQFLRENRVYEKATNNDRVAVRTVCNDARAMVGKKKWTSR
jgi:hypothetical protein